MPDTFVKIASVTVGSGGASSIDFTSIPSTYTDLCLKISARNSADTPDVTVQFNGVTTGYSDKWLYGNGSTAGSASNSAAYIELERSSYTANTFANGEMYITNYAGSNYKSFSTDSVTENNATTAAAYLTAALWSNTAAINRVTLTPVSGNFVQYSTATLYGIKNS